MKYNPPTVFWFKLIWNSHKFTVKYMRHKISPKNKVINKKININILIKKVTFQSYLSWICQNGEFIHYVQYRLLFFYDGSTSNREGHIRGNLDSLIPSLVRMKSKFVDKSLAVNMLCPFVFTINISWQEVSYAPHIFRNLQEISLWNNFKLAQYFNFKLSQIVNIYKEILLIVREIS